MPDIPLGATALVPFLGYGAEGARVYPVPVRLCLSFPCFSIGPHASVENTRQNGPSA